MKEAYYQSKIMKCIKDDGGVVVNGNYTSAGEADLQCGIRCIIDEIKVGRREPKQILIYCAVEVKTEEDYHRVMKGIDENYNIIDKAKLKKHEPLQMAKIRDTRKRGGLALVAYNYRQVLQYISEEAG